MSWQANASNYVNNLEVTGWFKDNKYKESIFKVMAKAIADYVLKKEEFENYNAKTKVVEFARTEPKKYTPENWNAVILWNFLAYVMDERYGKVTLDNDGVAKVGEIVKNHYKNQYNTEIGDAITDIQAYATDLKLYDYIRDLNQIIRDNKLQSNRLHTITDRFNGQRRSACVEIYNANVGNKTNVSIEIRKCESNGVCI